MIGQRRKSDVPIERCELAQLRWNQDAPLFVDEDFMRATDVKQFERSHLVIEARLLANLFLQTGPFVGRIDFEATLALEDEIRDIQAIMTIALQFFAEANRDTHPALLVDRVIESSVEHRLSP